VRRRAVIAALALFAGLALLPFFIHSDYWGTVLDTGGTYALVAVGLNLLCGGTGQFSLGHAGFFAVGAFTAAIMSVHGWPFWIGVPAGGLLAGAVGLVVGIPLLRVSGPYFAIATLAFGLLASDVFSTAGWSRARTGFSLNPPQIAGYTFSATSFFWVVLLFLVVGTAVAAGLRYGASGRAWVALRQSPPAARASGIHVGRYRVFAFVVSAVYAGAGGALLAHWALYVAAASFGLSLSILFVAMIVVGGLDSIHGSILGAAFLTALQELLSNAGQSQYAEPIYGAIIVVVLLFLPAGLVGLFRHESSPAAWGRRFVLSRGVRG
jgi:branched-chain amino acid transport system permease protein